MLRRTRPNADTIKGVAPDVTCGDPPAVDAGARPYHRLAPFRPVPLIVSRPGEDHVHENSVTFLLHTET
jgi:hypothetical protein